VPDLAFSYDIEIVSLLASAVHRYEGRPSDGPRDATGREIQDSIEVRAGMGIVGDRYFGQAAHVTASVTIQSIEALEHVQRELGVMLREVVESADGWGADCGVESVLIVEVQPARERLAAFRF